MTECQTDARKRAALIAGLRRSMLLAADLALEHAACCRWATAVAARVHAGACHLGAFKAQRRCACDRGSQLYPNTPKTHGEDAAGRLPVVLDLLILSVLTAQVFLALDR